jgi:hypothetical protein
MTQNTGSKESQTSELSEFLSLKQESSSAFSPGELLLSEVRSDLHPSFFRMAARLGAIHLVAGSSTLLVCPQFGVGPLGGGEGLMGVFMRFGEWACALGCGGFFASMTALAAWVFLSRDERRVLRAQGALHYSWIMVASVGLFMLVGEARSSELSYIALWLLGALAVGIFSSRTLPLQRSLQA